MKSKNHPRIVPSGSTGASISSLANASAYYKVIKDDFLIDADKSISVPLPADSPYRDIASFPSKAEFNAYQDKVKSTCQDESKYLEKLTTAYFLTSDVKYKDAAISRLMNLAYWSPEGATNENINDIANAWVYSALSEAFDLLKNDLNPTQHAVVIRSIKNRTAYVVNNSDSLDEHPYDSHGAGGITKLLSTLMLSVGESDFPEAEAWLAKVWEVYLTQGITVWGEQDGFFANGNNYSWTAMVRTAELAAIIKLTTGISLANLPWVRNFGKQMIAFTTPKYGLFGSYGDGVEHVNSYTAYYDDFRLYNKIIQNREYEWWWQVDPNNLIPSKSHNYSYMELMLLPILSTVTPLTPTKNNYISDETGIATFHDNVSNPNRSSVYFRSSSFGSHNHSHADQNSFSLVSKGVNLLISGGYYDNYLTSHHETVTRATRFKNALTFDGGIGQSEPSSNPTTPGIPTNSRDNFGRLINFYEDNTKAVITGDATAAYQGNYTTPLLTNAIRTLVYDKNEKVLIIYDYASSAKARKWELNFNSLVDFTITSSSSETLSRNGAAASIQVHGPSGQFTKTKDFPVLPSGGYPTADQPTQYQSRFSVISPTTSLASVTVIREDARSVPVSVSFNGDIATVSINGKAPMTFDQKIVRLVP